MTDTIPLIALLFVAKFLAAIWNSRGGFDAKPCSTSCYCGIVVGRLHSCEHLFDTTTDWGGWYSLSVSRAGEFRPSDRWGRPNDHGTLQVHKWWPPCNCRSSKKRLRHRRNGQRAIHYVDQCDFNRYTLRYKHYWHGNYHIVRRHDRTPQFQPRDSLQMRRWLIAWLHQRRHLSRRLSERLKWRRWPYPSPNVLSQNQQKEIKITIGASSPHLGN